MEEPEPEPQPDPVDEYRRMCGEVIEYFSNTVKIGPKTEEYLRTRLWNLGEFQDLFPVIYDYFGEKDNDKFLKFKLGSGPTKKRGAGQHGGKTMRITVII